MQNFRSLARFRAALVLSVALALVSPAVLAKLTASVDRNPLPPDVPVVLSVELEDSSEDPDFSVLDEQFQILSSRSGTNISVVNGDARRIRSWEFSLLPRPGSSGRIPALQAGKHRSRPIQLNFSDDPALAAQSAEVAQLSMKLSHAAAPVHVGEQLILDVSLRVQPGLANTRLNPPTAAGAVLEPLGKAQESTEVIQGVRYEVYAWRYAVFPEQSGRLLIQPPVFQAEQLSRRGSRNPFGSNLFGGSRTPIVARAQPQSVEVAAVPDGGDGPFLPARAVTLHEQILPEPETAKVGEPFTRVIELRVDGQLHSQLDPVDVALPNSARSYPEAPQGESLAAQQGVQARRVSRWVVIPDKPGTLELPGVTVRWWDTQADQWRDASLPVRRLQVHDARGGGQAEAKLGSPGSPRVADGDSSRAANAWWPAISAALLIAWIATLMAWWFSVRGMRANRTGTVSAAAGTESAARQRILTALHRGEPIHEVHSAVTAWARCYWQASDWPGSPSIQRLAEKLDPAPWATHLRALDRQVYGQGDGWDAKAAEVALQALPEMADGGPVATGLPPLYPSTGRL